MNTETKTINENAVLRDQTERSGESGFTVLETAISLLLMAIVGLGAASLFFYSAKNLVTAGDRDMAMAVGQQRMEQLRSVPFNDATLAATSGTSSVLIRAGRQYTVLTTITDSNVVNGAATTKKITVKVTPNNDNSTWARTGSSIFGSTTLVSVRSGLTVGPNRAL